MENEMVSYEDTPIKSVEEVEQEEKVEDVSDTSGVHENTCTSCEG